MSYGVLWQLGQPGEGKDRFHHDHHSDEETFEATLVTELEMGRLFTLLGVTTGVSCYEIVYPTKSDPEYSTWFTNLAEDPESTVEAFTPSSVDLLAAINEQDLPTLGSDWSKSIDDFEPKYAITVLQQLVAMARRAKSENMMIYAGHFAG